MILGGLSVVPTSHMYLSLDLKMSRKFGRHFSWLTAAGDYPNQTTDIGAYLQNDFDILSPLKFLLPIKCTQHIRYRETHNSLTYPTTMYTPHLAGFGYGP